LPTAASLNVKRFDDPETCLSMRGSAIEYHLRRTRRTPVGSVSLLPVAKDGRLFVPSRPPALLKHLIEVFNGT
jgi:hypothetical protein